MTHPAGLHSMSERYLLSADPQRIDRAQVHQWIGEESYWAQGGTPALQDAAMDGSRNYGVYDSGTGRQVAYGRVITDTATFAYICDVFVALEVRGQGIGTMLISGIIANLEHLGLQRILLSTADAHDFYAQFSFTALPQPGSMMVRTRP